MQSFEEALRHLLEQAFAEDIQDGDHSTLSCIPADAMGTAELKIKQNGILAGVEIARYILQMREPAAKFEMIKADSDPMEAGEIAFRVHAHVHSLLQCERLLLNCMQRMSGIASLTRQYTSLLEGYKTKLLDTRKTTPNFRLLEKEAVRIGGGVNHRFGLYDMIMLKDNHIDFCGSIELAIERAHAYVQEVKPGLKIEVEARSLDDVKRIIACGKGKVFRILLDNFTPESITVPVDLIADDFETEASGGINLENIQAYAASGVDFVSVGGLIHQARSLDLSFKAVIHK